jgi:hypothetical protein
VLSERREKRTTGIVVAGTRNSLVLIEKQKEVSAHVSYIGDLERGARSDPLLNREIPKIDLRNAIGV